GKLFVRRYVRPKYARPGGDGVVIGELPQRPIDKGIPGPGLLAQIIIDKYTDHLPVHRQIQRFEREGIKLPASTLTDWISGTCLLLERYLAGFFEQVKSRDFLTLTIQNSHEEDQIHRSPDHWDLERTGIRPESV